MTRFQPTRRDPRFSLAGSAGAATLRLDDGTGLVARLLSISVAGVSIGLAADRATSIERGDRLSPVTIRVGRCSVPGTLSVRNVGLRDDRCELGCHFIPDGDLEEARWMALLEGIEAGCAVDVDATVG